MTVNVRVFVEVLVVVVVQSSLLSVGAAVWVSVLVIVVVELQDSAELKSVPAALIASLLG